jgi:hypothetical protein
LAGRAFRDAALVLRALGEALRAVLREALAFGFAARLRAFDLAALWRDDACRFVAPLARERVFPPAFDVRPFPLRFAITGVLSASRALP